MTSRRRIAARRPTASSAVGGRGYTAKLNLLNELIVQEILLAKAKELKIQLPESELETAFNEAKKNIPPAAFDEELKKRNLTAADMREDLRRNLLAQKVVEKEVGEKATPSDADVKAFFDANKAQFNRTEDSVRIAQIVITPVREQQRANRTGDDAGSPQEATAKAQMLMQRLKEGHRVRRPRRGFLRGSRVGATWRRSRLRPDLGATPRRRRRCVMRCSSPNPGTVQLVSQGGAHTIVLIVAKDKKGQKDLSMPEVKERDQLDAEESQGAAVARRLSLRAAQRRHRHQRAREADRPGRRQGGGNAEGRAGSNHREAVGS